jgi:hypothetical protein
MKSVFDSSFKYTPGFQNRRAPLTEFGGSSRRRFDRAADANCGASY